ncbi:hypothetical protein CsNV_047 [Callinectes sapidus nudivirus]|nr:hypothetical protein CsNV_047 [Callinectes sapidus nudivirus]
MELGEELNDVLMSSDDYEEKKRILKFKPTKLNIPKVIMKIVHDNNLNEIPDVDERSKVFIKALYKRKLKSSSVLKYFNALKPSLFPNTNILPNPLVFDENYPKRMQNRGGNLNNIKNFINYAKFVLPNNSLYKWPILISSYSGLRLSEVCNIKFSHLQMILDEKPIIPLKRKNNKDWEVIYYEEFTDVIKDVVKNNIERYNLFITKQIDQKLFPYTTQALHSMVRHYYTLANKGASAPPGFGLHSIRYYLATLIMDNTNKIEIAQSILGHVKQKTTELYIKPNYNKREKELEELCEHADLFSNIKHLVQNAS